MMKIVIIHKIVPKIKIHLIIILLVIDMEALMVVDMEVPMEDMGAVCTEEVWVCMGVEVCMEVVCMGAVACTDNNKME